MAKDNRSLYEVTINGVKHTLKLDQDDADRYGDAAVKVDTKKAPANKAAGAATNKAGGNTSDKTDTK